MDIWIYENLPRLQDSCNIFIIEFSASKNIGIFWLAMTFQTRFPGYAWATVTTEKKLCLFYYLNLTLQTHLISWDLIRKNQSELAEGLYLLPPVSHCSRRWLKINLYVCIIFNWLKKILKTYIVWYLEKERSLTLK